MPFTIDLGTPQVFPGKHFVAVDISAAASQIFDEQSKIAIDCGGFELSTWYASGVATAIGNAAPVCEQLLDNTIELTGLCFFDQDWPYVFRIEVVDTVQLKIAVFDRDKRVREKSIADFSCTKREFLTEWLKLFVLMDAAVHQSGIQQKPHDDSYNDFTVFAALIRDMEAYLNSGSR
jgi:hypothetical protein